MTRRRRRGGIARRLVECPECGHRFRDVYRRGVRRFKARLVKCPECGHVEPAGAFSSPGSGRVWDVPDC